VARSREPVESMGFVSITPQFTLDACPAPDIVVVPGGDAPAGDEVLRAWVQAQSKRAELMMSVCNGALVYARAGLLGGMDVTTHHSALQELALMEPEARVLTNRRFVDNGQVLTAAGIAAGIDGALHVVERFCGEQAAWETARQMEYDWRPDEIAKLHAQPAIAVDNSEALRLVGSIRRLGPATALEELKKLEPQPTEQQLNTWGYWLLGSERAGDAAELFRLVTLAHPQSANAQDSLSEALEAKGDREGALQAARACLAQLERASDRPEGERKLLRNASASRVARLTGAPAKELRFVCPPCGRACDGVGYLEGGSCPNCHMALAARPD
jgi:putative intracellular protease/amidase